MDNKKSGFNSIDEYITTFPKDIQKINPRSTSAKLRTLIKN